MSVSNTIALATTLGAMRNEGKSSNSSSEPNFACSESIASCEYLVARSVRYEAYTAGVLRSRPSALKDLFALVSLFLISYFTCNRVKKWYLVRSRHVPLEILASQDLIELLLDGL